MLDNKNIDEQVRYLRIALGMTGISLTETTTEMILRIFNAIEKMGGDYSLRDAAIIQANVEKKYQEKYQPVIFLDKLESIYKEIEDVKEPEKILETIKGLINSVKGPEKKD